MVVFRMTADNLVIGLADAADSWFVYLSAIQQYRDSSWCLVKVRAPFACFRPFAYSIDALLHLFISYFEFVEIEAIVIIHNAYGFCHFAITDNPISAS